METKTTTADKRDGISRGSSVTSAASSHLPNSIKLSDTGEDIQNENTNTTMKKCKEDNKMTINPIEMVAKENTNTEQVDRNKATISPDEEFLSNTDKGLNSMLEDLPAGVLVVEEEVEEEEKRSVRKAKDMDCV